MVTQRKYTLDLLREIKMLSSQPFNTHIEQNLIFKVEIAVFQLIEVDTKDK